MWEKSWGFARRSDFGVISSHSLLLSDQASWVKKIQRDLKVRTKPKISLNDVWVRKNPNPSMSFAHG